MLFCVAPKKYNLPQLLFSMVCSAKHVPQSVRLAQERKAQRLPATTMHNILEVLNTSGVHETRIARLLSQHGKPNKPLCHVRADNYQHRLNGTASASAVDPTKDRAHIVFTSSIKSGKLIFVMFLYVHRVCACA